MKKFFISHSSKDKDLVESFVSNILQLGLKINEESIFCTSSEGMGIKSGEEWRDRIKTELFEADVILLLVTPNYKASEICLNEMGAAWVVGKKVIPLVFGDVTYKSVGVIIDTKQVERGDKEDGLTHLCDNILELLPHKKEKFKTSVWDSKKRKFLDDYQKFLSKNPFPDIYSQQEIQNEINKRNRLQKDYDELLTTKEKMDQEIEQLKRCKDAHEVEEVVKSFDDSTVLERFQGLLQEARNHLQTVPGVVRTLIFNSRYDGHLSVIGFLEELGEAEAKRLIEERNDVFVPCFDKKVMKEICSSLDCLEEFLDGVTSQEFAILEQNYDSMTLNDLDFWQNVIGVTMSYRS